MAGTPRYLWGNTKVGFVTFVSRTTPPAAKAGRMYFDGDAGQFRACVDGTSYLIMDLAN